MDQATDGEEALLLALEAKASALDQANHALQLELAARAAMEHALRESAALLSEAQRSAGIGSWRYRPAGTFILSCYMYELFGLPRDAAPTPDAVLSVVHPDDRTGSFPSALVRAIDSGATEFEAEHRIVWPDARIRTVIARGTVRRDAGGQLLEAVGTVQDLTLVRTADEEVRRREARYLAQRAALIDLTTRSNSYLLAPVEAADWMRGGGDPGPAV